MIQTHDTVSDPHPRSECSAGKCGQLPVVPTANSEAFALFELGPPSLPAELAAPMIPAELVRELLRKIGDLLERNPDPIAAGVGSIAGTVAGVAADIFGADDIAAAIRSIDHMTANLRPAAAGRSRRPSCKCGKHLRACECGLDKCPGWHHQTTGSHWCEPSVGTALTLDLATPVTNTKA